jgi:hypothetical protein
MQKSMFTILCYNQCLRSNLRYDIHLVPSQMAWEQKVINFVSKVHFFDNELHCEVHVKINYKTHTGFPLIMADYRIYYN